MALDPNYTNAGEIAATAFAETLPGVKPRQEEIDKTIRMVKESYRHATASMHALLVEFLWDRFA
jgi:hypothetical protein